jgi:RNA ligase (TIGR02306 family)
MSTFAVTIESIDRVWAHPNADRLELASLRGMRYQFCIPKGEYAPGDTVVYFPIDSLLPPALIETLGLTGKLRGKEADRIATVKLRGEISQGVVAHPAMVLPAEFVLNGHHDVTDLLGVTKYEAPEVSIRGGKLVSLPDMVSVYDIEGADRFPNIADMLLDVPVVVTEKVEGSHFSASLYADGSLAICQRRFRILTEDGEIHDWHAAAEREGVPDALRKLWEMTGAQHAATLRGEVIGPSVQGNLYGLKERTILFFEVEIDGKSIEAEQALALIAAVGLKHVPVLASGQSLRAFLDDRSVQQASTGKTAVPGVSNPDMLREGIVIRPITEMRDESFGRVIIKQRSPAYLEWSGL